MEQISAIIIDDEPLAREGLNIRMRSAKDFVVIGQCANGKEAFSRIMASPPDVIFVDVEMPGLNGIELVEALHKQRIELPIIVFVTAFKEFALDAFEQHAFDYLLKPYSDDRLQSCLEKLRDAYQEKHALNKQRRLDHLLSYKTGKSLDGFIQTLEHSAQTSIADLQQTMSIKSGSEWLRLKLDTINLVEAAGDYLCIYTDESNHIVRKTLKQLETELDANWFVRVNRSVIVNRQKIVKLTPNSNGEYYAHMAEGQTIKVSRRYKYKLDELDRKLVR